MKQHLRFSILLVLCAMTFSSCGKKQELPHAKQPFRFVPPAALPTFSGARTFDLLVHQVQFGPRVPNTPGHDSCAAFLLNFLTPLAAKVNTQDFSFPGYESASLQLKNIIASFNPSATSRVLLCAHWDSRPWADREEKNDDKAKGIPGANDGASGVAVLLHLAEIFSKTPPSIGVDMVFFDGEDYGKESDESLYCIGSKYFAASIASESQYLFGILLDLVGDKDAEFPQEESSVQYASDIVQLVWSSARQLGTYSFKVKGYSGILDDHTALNTNAGIKTIDIIDAELVGHHSTNPRRKYWHTLKDTPDQCSPKTLEGVGKVLLYIISGIKSS